MRKPTKADMARELDALRHRVSQLSADLERVSDENRVLRAENDVVHKDLNRATRYQSGHFASRRDAMAAARDEAIRSGKSVKVIL